MLHCKKYIGHFNGQYLLLLYFVVFAIWGHAQSKNSNIDYKVKAYRSGNVYNSSDNHIGYYIKLRNRVNDAQRGSIKVEVKNSFGQSVYYETISLYLTPHGGYYKELDFDRSKLSPGFYNANFVINTDRSNDTLTNIFGVDVERIFPTVHRPYDFTNFWNDAKRDLAAINPAYRITKRGDKSTDYTDVYLIEFQSIDNVTIRGWLTVPKENRNYAVIYQISGYMGNLNPDTRKDIAVFTLNVRGNGNSENTVSSDYNTYLTQDLCAKNKSIYRAAYMDALRGLEFLYRSADLKLDVNRIILNGEGQGACIAAAVAGMDSKVKGLIVERPLFVDMRSQFNISESLPFTPWPVYAFKDYLNRNKISTESFFNTWDYFDPQSFAIDIHCSTLVAIAMKSTYSPAQSAYNFYNQVRVPKREMYLNPDSDNGMESGFYLFQNQWIKEVFRSKN